MAYSTDPTLFLYTSLTAGSSHIITATSRLETILKANKIPFRAIDCATDEKARMLWGRRSKGRKLPGLVRYGSVVGDLEQIEEWNEYGELKEQINATHESSSGATPTSTPSRPSTINITGSLQPEPPATSPRPPSNASSRTSSQGRHISISEPTAAEKQRDPSPKPTSEPKARSPSAESPQNLIMRQLGAEAAAKAKDRKPSGTKAAAAPTGSPAGTTTAQTPTPASTMEQEATHPSEAPEMTAAKTPAQLASEGKTRSSTDKIEGNEASPTSSPAGERSGSTSENEDKSTEEQILNLRRTSTQTKLPSRLSVATPAEESGNILRDKDVEEEAGDTSEKKEAAEVEPEHVGVSKASNNPKTDTAREPSTASAASGSTSSASMPPPERRRSHRGSSLEDADIEAIRRAEAANRIQEEEEAEDDKELETITEKVDKRERGEHDEESVEKEVEAIKTRRSVGIGKDATSEEVMDVEDDEEKEGKDAEEVDEEGAKVVDAEKEEEMRDAKVDLPSGKETDIEGIAQGTKPQETKAADMEDASKSVGD